MKKNLGNLENEILHVNGIPYRALRLLGRGKGGYSYLARQEMSDGDSSGEGNLIVLKKIHHEPCSYYTFGNKIEAEMRDYKRLCEVGIPMPEMYAVDEGGETIIKEFIDGPTVMDMLKNSDEPLPDDILSQARNIAEMSKTAGLNIDYFPTNFIYAKGKLWYVDYECNAYMDEWSFDSWGVKYWSHTSELKEYLENHGN